MNWLMRKPVSPFLSVGQEQPEDVLHGALLGQLACPVFWRAPV